MRKLDIDAEAALKRLPEHCQAGLRRYIEDHVQPGGFLSAVLRNDLRDAVMAADDINRARLDQYVIFLYNHAPSACWGGERWFNAWIEGEDEK